MHTPMLVQIGNPVGVVLPKELLARLNVERGDTLHATEAPNGVRLTTTNPEFEAQMKHARQIMKRRRDALAELAK